MSGLFGSLSMAARALDAQRYGLDVAGQNIANVNTPGYTRRQVTRSALPPDDFLSPGNGVEITGLRATRDLRLERRLQQERPAEHRLDRILGAATGHHHVPGGELPKPAQVGRQRPRQGVADADHVVLVGRDDHRGADQVGGHGATGMRGRLGCGS